MNITGFGEPLDFMVLNSSNAADEIIRKISSFYSNGVDLDSAITSAFALEGVTENDLMQSDIDRINSFLESL